MNRYSIFCTPEQTKRAYKLGAPIYIFVHAAGEDKGSYKPIDEFTDALIPTAEQICGWLRKKNIFINVCHNCDGYGTWIKKIVPSEPIGDMIGYFETEPQATLSAIDAALDYLEKGESV